MERPSHSNRGQAIIENILGITVITLFIALTTQLALNFRTLFKHDYLGAPADSTSRSSPDKFSSAELLKNNLVSFESGSANKNIHNLKNQGWKVRQRLRVEDGLMYVLDNGTKNMIFSSQLGVISCSTDCGN